MGALKTLKDELARKGFTIEKSRINGIDIKKNGCELQFDYNANLDRVKRYGYINGHEASSTADVMKQMLSRASDGSITVPAASEFILTPKNLGRT